MLEPLEAEVVVCFGVLAMKEPFVIVCVEMVLGEELGTGIPGSLGAGYVVRISMVPTTVPLFFGSGVFVLLGTGIDAQTGVLVAST